MENKELQIQFIKNLALALKSKVKLLVDDLSLKLSIKEKSFLSSVELLMFYDHEIKSIHDKVDGCFPQVTEYFSYFLQNDDETGYDFCFERFLTKNYRAIIENCFDKFDTSEYPSAPEVLNMFDNELFLLELHSTNSTMNNFISYSSNAIFKHTLAAKYEALVIKNRDKKKQLETPMVSEKVEPDLSIGLVEIKEFKNKYLNILKSFDSFSLEKLESINSNFLKLFATEPYFKVPHIIAISDKANMLNNIIKDLTVEYSFEPTVIQQIADQLILILENKTTFENTDFTNPNYKNLSLSINQSIEKQLNERSAKEQSHLFNMDFLQKSSEAKYLDTKFDLANLGQASTNPKIILHHNIIDAKAQWNILEKEILSSNEPLDKNTLSLLIEQFTASSKDCSAEQKKISNIYINGLKSLKKQLKTIHKMKSQSDKISNSTSILERV